MYTKEQIAEIVENEGLGYTFTHYLDPKQIEDEELRELGIQAQTALRKIESILEEFMP